MEDAHHTVRSQSTPGKKSSQKILDWVSEQPVRAAFYAYIAIAAVTVAGTALQVQVLPALAPEHPDQLLQSAWQVHAGFSAIAFAGLVMLVDLAGRESNVTATSERQFLLKRTNFDFALTFALIGNVAIAIAANWLPTEETLIVSVFLVIAPSTYLVARGYLRAIRVLTHPQYATVVERESIKRALRLSIEASTARRIANGSIDDVIERTWLTSGNNAEPLVAVENDSYLADVNIDALRQVLSTPTSPAVTQDPSLAEPPTPLEIKLLVSIGNRIKAGGFLFVADRKLTDTERAILSKNLRATVRVSEETR